MTKEKFVKMIVLAQKKRKQERCQKIESSDIVMLKSGKVINGIYWFAAATLNATVAMMGE